MLEGCIKLDNLVPLFNCNQKKISIMVSKTDIYLSQILVNRIHSIFLGEVILPLVSLSFAKQKQKGTKRRRNKKKKTIRKRRKRKKKTIRKRRKRGRKTRRK